MRYTRTMDDAPEITVLQLPKFKAEATEFIGADGIEALAVCLVSRPAPETLYRAQEERASCDGRRKAKGSAGARESYICRL
jgi:hypothetical protein